MAIDRISVRGARQHNLKNINVDIPRDQFTVITGLSGSGKSSLAFDTIYAEGQRRYVESLSAYARQFLDQLEKPEVESIDGLSPAISIEQKTVSRNPRSTVGTATEIYDYLRLLFARAGAPHCPHCGLPIASQGVDAMAARVLAMGEGARVDVMAPVVRGRKGEYRKELAEFRAKGFTRARIDGELRELDDELKLAKTKRHDVDVVVDRIAVKESARAGVEDSIPTALRMADGLVKLDRGDGAEPLLLSEKNACASCGFSFPEIAPRLFSFNSPAGACAACDGLGTALVFDAARIVPDPERSLGEGALAPWRRGAYYAGQIAAVAAHLGVDLATPWQRLPRAAQEAFLHGLGDEPIPMTLARRGKTDRVKRRFDGVLGELERRLDS